MKFTAMMRIWLAVIVLQLFACSGPERHTHTLLDSASEPSSDSEAARMRKLQAITVFNTETKQPEEVLRLDLHRFGVSVACLDLNRVPSGCRNPTANTCTDSLCSAAYAACIAKTFLALTKPQSIPPTFGVWAIPLQKPGAIADMADWALGFAIQGADQFSSDLEAMSGSPRVATDACVGQAAAGIAGTTNATFAAAGFKELYDVYREAVATKVQAALDLSDAELNSSSSLALASQRSLVNWRLGVGTFPVGGTATALPSSETGAFCTTSPPREQARAAMAIFRDAALPPDDLLGTATTSSLLNGTTALPPNGSVRQRIAQFYGKPELLNTTTVPRIEDYYNLDMSAFDDARKVLKEEIVAFSRSRTAKLRKRALPDGTLATIDSYAGTAGAVQRAPAAYYGALARTNDTTRPTLTRAYSAGAQIYQGAGAGFNNDMEGFFGAAKHLSNVTKNLPVAVRDVASAPIGMMVANQDLAGHVAFSMNATNYNLDVYGFSSADNIRVVRGEDALRCAVEGNVESAPCALATVADNTAVAEGTYVLRPPTAILPVAHYGFTKSASFVYSSGSGTGRFYLLKPKSSAGTTPAPGEYEALTGVTIALNKPYTLFSIVRGSDEQLARILEPSTEWCARPRLTCDGVEFDERIPLENELASDGDGLESSWRHYLQLAKEAAARADQLGADYIGAGLEDAIRSETVEIRQQQQAQLADSYLQRLQTICGTQVDTRALLNKLKDASGFNLIATGGTCTSNASCTNGHGAWSCQQTRCVVDLGKLVATFASQDPDTQRLSDCLSQTATTPFISLGNLPLCVWQDQANPNLVCSGAAPGKCPFVKPSDKTCVQATTLPATVTTPQLAKETVPLGYFDMSQDAGATGDVTDHYKAMADFPLTPAKWATDGEKIRNSNVLDPFRLLPFAQRLNWEARFGGFSAITLDGATIWESGSPSVGPKVNVWPCRSLASLPSGPNPFSPLRNCSDGWQRQSANQEMFAAVVAAKAMVGAYQDLEQLSGDGKHVARTNSIDLATVPFLGACGGTVQARDNSTYYRAGEGILRTSTENGQTYSFLASNLYSYYPTVASGCFRPGAVRVEPIEYFHNSTNGLFVSQQYKGALARYLTGDAAVSPETPVAKFTWNEGRLINDDGGSSSSRSMTVSLRSYLTGLQLLAYAGQQPAAVSLNNPPVVQTVDDLESVSQYLSLLAQSIRSASGRAVFANIPDKVRDALRSESAVGAYPQFGGEMSEAISAARGALLRIRENGPLVSNEVQQMAYDIRQVKALLQKSEIKKDVSKLQFMSTMTQQLATCASASASGATLDFVAAIGNGVAAAITCANSIAQIGFAQGIADLTIGDAKLDADLAVADFGSKFGQHATSLQTLSLHLAQGQEDLDVALATIDKLRIEAGSQLSHALYAASEQAAHQAEVTNVVGNLYAGKQVRYQAALSNARRMAFLAKRAIEQRLGIRLAEMTEDMPLVEAPQKWEASACTFTGVNYSSLKATDGSAPLSYANGFIGDYVTKLENVVESYRLQHNFQEGTDTAVISLRDDIFNVRAECPVRGANLLYDAGQLDRTLEPGWNREGCATEVVNGTTLPKADCITVKPMTTAGPVFTDPTTSAVTPYTITFGVNATDALAGIFQELDVEPGIYRLSYYANGAGGSGWGTSLNVSAASAGHAQGQGPTVNGWYRYYYRFNITKPGRMKFGFRKPASGVMNVAAPMLERLTTPSHLDDVGFIPFVNTGTTRDQMQPACEDSDGTVFRSTRWQRNCVRLCADGFGEECEGDRARSYCYLQTDFNINQRDIQQGRVFNYSGFARGNYNYRIDSVSLNFVGTPRNCSAAGSPQACFSAGFVPYSLAHVGPFVVRNHSGADVPAHLFDGNIEHARGLALERYITNPLSDGDRALLDQYARREFQGRPLDGNFVVRVWEEPGVDFGSISDVQVVMNYRYWTKSN